MFSRVIFDDNHIKILLKRIEKDIYTDMLRGGGKSRPKVELLDYLKRVLSPGCAGDIFVQIHQGINLYKELDSDSLSYVGMMEQNLDQYLSPLLHHFKDEIRIVQIIRDPRSIVASRNYGKYTKTKGGGMLHSLLAIAKMWRTSCRY